jgi:hypothetical protein
VQKQSKGSLQGQGCEVNTNLVSIQDIDAVQGIKVGYDSENSHILDLATPMFFIAPN